MARRGLHLISFIPTWYKGIEIHPEIAVQVCLRYIFKGRGGGLDDKEGRAGWEINFKIGSTYFGACVFS